MGVPTYGPIKTYKNPSIAKGPTSKSFLFSTESRCREGCSHDHKKLKPSTSSFTFLSQRSHASWGFPPNPPPRPWLCLSCTSTAAFVSRSRTTTEAWPNSAAMCSGVLPQERRPEAKPQAEPYGRKGRKTLRKFWAPQRSKFWKLWPLNLLHELKEHCDFEMSWWHRVGWRPLLPLAFCWSRVSHVCLQSGCTWINSNILPFWKTNTPMILGHHILIENICYLSLRFVYIIAPGISCNWPNTAQLAVRGKENFRSSHETCRKCSCHMSSHQNGNSGSSPEQFLNSDGRAMACQPMAL